MIYYDNDNDIDNNNEVEQSLLRTLQYLSDDE